MKLLVIGCGQCGGRIADEFARLNARARARRGVNVVTDCLAVNTDAADLSGLRAVPRDYGHRVLIGGQRTGGHGVGKINELGAAIAKEDIERVLEAIAGAQQLLETDAFLIAGSAAGGTGSGAMSVITYHLKDRFPQKPAYDLVVLPFKHEEMTEARSVINTATCLKSAYLVADAVFLVDNDRFVRKHLPIGSTLSRINRLIVEPFYDLLCAGEEKSARFIGSKVLDAGDIMQTLAGWTTIGHGSVRRPWFEFLREFSVRHKKDFRQNASRTEAKLKALDAAIADLSLKCNPRDAHRALYLLSAPAGEMHLALIKDLGATIRTVATEAMIRTGDYPGRRRSLDVTLILSEFGRLKKVTDCFDKAAAYLATKKMGATLGQGQMEDAFKDIPTLL